jgi:CheY-like chemotaxis protein
VSQPATILVVDDDPGIQHTIGSILEDEGYAVVSAWNGHEALAHFDGDGVAPALIVLDLQMPVMDGYAFTAALRERGLRSKVPVMVLTADGRAQQKALQVGADGYLAKPFTLAELLEQVARLVRPSPQA